MQYYPAIAYIINVNFTAIFKEHFTYKDSAWE